MNRTLPLRALLFANCVFSVAAAGLMISKPTLVGGILGFQNPFILQVVGAGLIIFAADLLHQVTRYRMSTWRALYASIGDLLWVLTTVVLLGLFPNVLSNSGLLLTCSVAVIVFTLGACQFLAIGFAHKIPGKSLYRHCIPVFVDVPADQMWSVISQLSDIHKYTPFLKSSTLLDGIKPGIGAVRACEDQKGNQWREECVGFDVGRRVTLRFLAEDPDFPLPAHNMRGGWEITSRENGCEVMVWWELSPKPELLAPIILPLFAFKMDKYFPAIIRNMAMVASGRSQEPELLKNAKPRVSILPDFC